MKTFLYNLGYFLREAVKTIKYNLLSNFISVLGTGLILFLLGFAVVFGSIGSEFVATLSREAEISAYINNSNNRDIALKLVNTIQTMDGVREARLVDEAEAHDRMKELLGEEAQILELFDDNPFEAFIEIRIDLEDMNRVIAGISALQGINYVRDNRAVLEQLQGIIQGLKLFGYLVIIAVGITTIILISHMIRQGIYNNREHIHTLSLLGAPGSFIGIPYVLTGLLLTLLGGLIAIALLFPLLTEGYRQLEGALPFIPLPPRVGLIRQVGILILEVSAVLGVLGSLFGLSSIRNNKL